ncbi:MULTISPECIES: hypothetical protein [Thermomonosporaceae]|uniref:hypothetical protein n=1 Tax=Thermomonosporaceae TaxID=2012 RepID=UPI00255B3468|nr:MULTISPECIES: hypothetical protein [Thermomonosporaceae]MDL4775681.1 hypothetical protein [Actinomadura xylanilytica]
MQLPRVVIAAVFFIIGALIAVPALMKATSSQSRASGAPASTSASPSPSGSGSSASPSPTADKSKTPPAKPVKLLSATIAAVDCPARTVSVSVHNTGSRTEDYGIHRDDGSADVAGRISPGATRTTTIKLREDRRTQVGVTWKNEKITTKTRTADCKKAGAAPEKTPPTRLPHTGADSSVLWARGATGAAAMVTGLIIFWYGGIWPRRREQVFGKKNGA